MNPIEEQVLKNEPTIGETDASECLPAWIDSFCMFHEASKGITLTASATTALCHTLIAARVRAEGLVKERDELQAWYDDAQQVSMDRNLGE